MRTEERPATVRHTPIEGVLVTDAEIDHTLGIVLLREGGHLSLYATAAHRGFPAALPVGPCRGARLLQEPVDASATRQSAGRATCADALHDGGDARPGVRRVGLQDRDAVAHDRHDSSRLPAALR